MNDADYSDIRIEDAQYTLATLDIFRGNPLIEALPDFVNLSRTNIGDMLMGLPPFCRSDMTSKERSYWLVSLCDDLFVPLGRHMELFEIIDLMLRQGYRHRNPRLPEGADYLKEAPARFKAEAAKPLPNWHETFSACLVGCSGTGKTRGVSRILDQYPTAIRHNKLWTGMPLLQIVHVRVDCPHDGGVKALCSSIIAEIGRIAGTNYAEEFIKKRSTLESLKMTLVRLMSLHRVGLLVIDEMQNIVNSTKNREDLFNFIVSLSNSLSVPILFIGTPKLKRFMRDNLRTARRFGSLGSFNWDRLLPTIKRRRKTSKGEVLIEEPNPDWRRFIDSVWHTVVLREAPAYMPKEIEETLFDLTQGVVDFMLKLLILSQMRALTVSLKDEERPETLTPGLLRRVFEDHFEHVKPMTDALRSGDDVKIAAFEDITFKEEDFKDGVKSLLDEISELAEASAERGRRLTYAKISRVLRELELEESPELVAKILEIAESDKSIPLLKAVYRGWERVQADSGTTKELARTADIDASKLPVGGIGEIQ